jgi:hypothetical protein
MDNVGIWYGRLVYGMAVLVYFVANLYTYFVAIWYTLFCGHLVYFILWPFGVLYFMAIWCTL